MQATVDTGLGPTVLETTNCATCGSGKLNTASGNAGLTVTTTAVSGNLRETTYTGVTGTTTFCIYSSTKTVLTKPTSANIASMPCIASMKVQFANSVVKP